MSVAEVEAWGVPYIVRYVAGGHPIAITEQGEDVAYIISKSAMDSFESALRQAGEQAINLALDEIASKETFSTLSEACARLGVNVSDVLPGGPPSGS